VVALDQGARELALAPDELEAVPLERALARDALAERLTLDHQRPDPQTEGLDGVLVHDGPRCVVFAAPSYAPARPRPRLVQRSGERRRPGVDERDRAGLLR
jgi:hypothetical protein